jgi:hypothetical protein
VCFLLFTELFSFVLVAMTWLGMEKANESSQSAMDASGAQLDASCAIQADPTMGNDSFGHAFMMDTGSSTGEISGHSKTINAVSIRHQRPFRAATSGDDATIVFFTGELFILVSLLSF